MGMTSHALTIWHTHHDWIALGFSLLAPLSTAAVGVIALAFSNQQNKRLADTNERNAKVAERNAEASKQQADTSATKLRIDLFDQRFTAWRELDRIAENWRNAVQDGRPFDITGLNEARHRLYFLFGADVEIASAQLVKEIFTYQRSESKVKRMDVRRDAGAAIDVADYMKTADLVDKSFNDSQVTQDRLRDAVRSYIRLHEVK